MDNKQIIKQFKEVFGYCLNTLNAEFSTFPCGLMTKKEGKFIDIRVEIVNELAQKYEKLVEENWQDAKQVAIDNIFYYKERLQRNELMFGKQSKIYNDIYTKLRVAEFVCDSLPYLKED